MKKVFVLFLLVVCCLNNITAQRTGLKAGVTLASAQYTVKSTSISTSNLAGFHGGLMIELPVSNSVFINTGLFYSQKGMKMSILGVEGKVSIDYLEIPLSLTYKYDLIVAKLFVQLGPYIGLGLSGRVDAGQQVQKIEFGSDNDELKRTDFGINVGGDIEIKFIQLGVNYGLGLVDLENDPEAIMMNGVLSLSTGILF